MAKRNKTRFSSLPSELLLTILSFLIHVDSDTLNYLQKCKLLLAFQSINKSLNSTSEMQEYFNNIWWKLFESQVRINEKHRINFEQARNQMIQMGNLRRKILLFYYTKRFLMKFPSHEQNENEIKITLLGDGGVGRSSLVIQFIQGNFLEYNLPTIDDSYRKQFEIDGVQYTLEIFDMYGVFEEDFPFKEQSILNSDCILIVCSLTSPSSYYDLEYHFELISKYRGMEFKMIPIIFALNKVDDFQEEEEKNQMIVEVKQVINEYICKYGLLNTSIWITSAKDRINVEETFSDCVKLFNGLDFILLKEIMEKDLEYLKNINKKMSQTESNRPKRCILM